MIIAIDGPSGSGKSTVSRCLAQKIGGIVLDTGAMYRSIAFLSKEAGIEDEAGIVKIAEKVVFEIDVKKQFLMANGKDLGDKIRTEEIGKRASGLSMLAGVRNTLTMRQRELGEKLSAVIPVVAEGRDVCTVVFPDTPYKFFITAEPEVRAKRRLEQLKDLGMDGLSLRKTLDAINNRDIQDLNRKIAPLKCEKDTYVIDTSRKTIDEVISELVDQLIKISEGLGIKPEFKLK